MEASSLDIKFSLVFSYSTSKPEASGVDSSMFFEYCSLKQATQTQSSWSAQLMDLRVHCGCGLDCGKSVGHVSKAHNMFGVRCLIVQHPVVGEILQALVLS
jgi:hypothetical protein